MGTYAVVTTQVKAIDGDIDSTDITDLIIIETSDGQSFTGGDYHYLGDFNEDIQIFVTYSVTSPTSGMSSSIDQIININVFFTSLFPYYIWIFIF